MNHINIDKVACIGAGTIGSSWTTYFSLKGLKVNIQDLNEDILEDSKDKINSNFDYLQKNGVIGESEIEAAKKNITYTTSLEEAVSDVKFIQENVLEKYEIKEKVIKEIDDYLKDDVILASSSSGLLASKIQSFSKYPENVIIAHPYNPPHLIPLVEIVKGNASDKTVKVAKNFYKKIGKVPIVIYKEVPGHVANRIQAAVWRESIDLVKNGVCTVEDVDAAISNGPGLRWALMGPNMIFHLGGGEKGIKGFLEQFQEPFESWWKDMADWNEFPENFQEILSDGITQEMGDETISDKVKWRDEKLIEILKVLDLM